MASSSMWRLGRHRPQEYLLNASARLLNCDIMHDSSVGMAMSAGTRKVRRARALVLEHCSLFLMPARRGWRRSGEDIFDQWRGDATHELALDRSEWLVPGSGSCSGARTLTWSAVLPCGAPGGLHHQKHAMMRRMVPVAPMCVDTRALYSQS